MRPHSSILKGTIHGKTIELEREPGLPDGQAVSVTLRATEKSGPGLRAAFGGWSETGMDLDQFLDKVRRKRKQSRAASEE